MSKPFIAGLVRYSLRHFWFLGVGLSLSSHEDFIYKAHVRLIANRLR